MYNFIQNYTYIYMPKSNVQLYANTAQKIYNYVQNCTYNCMQILYIFIYTVYVCMCVYIYIYIYIYIYTAAQKFGISKIFNFFKGVSSAQGCIYSIKNTA